MLRSKLDIFKKEWLEVVFEGRNKEYGAYELRRLSPRATNIGLVVASTLFVFSLVASKIPEWLGLSSQDDLVETFIEQEVTLAEPPPIDEEEPQVPPPVEPPPPRVDQVRMPEMAVTPAEEVTDEEPPTVEILKLADPGSQTLAGDPNAAIRIDLPVGEGELDAEVTEAPTNAIINFEAVEIAPIPAEGSINAFRTWVGNNYRVPPAATDAGVNGLIEVSFVIETDGSLTDLVVRRDLRFGTGEELMRLLRSAKKWKPGIQNGRPVRVAYTLPLRINTTGI